MSLFFYIKKGENMNIYQEASTDVNILGYEYYLENKISKIKQINEYKFEGYADNSKGNLYHIMIDTLVPKNSSCECKYASKKKICKHMIALSYSIFEQAFTTISLY